MSKLGALLLTGVGAYSLSTQTLPPVFKKQLETLGPRFTIYSDSTQQVNVVDPNADSINLTSAFHDDETPDDQDPLTVFSHDTVNLDADSLNLERCPGGSLSQQQQQFSLFGNRMVNIFCGLSD
jgi:hypothetical protein